MVSSILVVEMSCVSERAAELVAQYDPHVAGDITHTVDFNGDVVVIRYTRAEWPISVAEQAAKEEHVTAAEAERVCAEVQAHGLPAAVARELSERERLYLALLDLAPEFQIPCRPDGAIRDITVSRHRNGPDAPWQWAVHRLGQGMATFAWDGNDWWVVDDRARMLAHAAFENPIAAIAEARQIAAADVQRGKTEVEGLDW